MSLIKKCALILVLLLSAQRALAQHPDSLLTVQEAQADIDSLLQTIKDSHPKPGGFADQLSFETSWVAMRNSITTPQTTLEFSKLVAQLMCPMHDSHSCIDYGQLQVLAFNGKGFFLPLNCFTYQSKLYVRNDWQDSIPQGSELLSINGISATELYNTALAYACTEGDALQPQKRVADALLPLVAALYAHVDSVNVVEVVNFENNKTNTFHLRGYTKKQYKILKRERSHLKNNKTLTLDFSPQYTCATLKVGSFAPSKTGYYKRFIKNAFKQIAQNNCDSLILDLRDNGGGSSSWVEYLYSFIDTAGHNTPNNVIAKNSTLALKRAKPLTRSFSKFIMRTFFKKNEDVVSFLRIIDLPPGQLDTTYFTKKTKQRASLVFNKKCFLMINGLTASAAVDFTQSFVRNQRGKVVGEACLGPLAGTWGNPAMYTLPNSKLRVSIATIRYNYDNTFEYEPHPIQPDIEVLPTPQGAYSKQDEVLQFIISGKR
jgi:Peptidase family S41